MVWGNFGRFWVFGFFQRSPLWNNENKCCLNYIKFWEVLGNPKTTNSESYMENPKICQGVVQCLRRQNLILFWPPTSSCLRRHWMPPRCPKPGPRWSGLFFSKTFLKKHNGCFKCLCCLLLLLCKKKLLAINVERQLAMAASLHNWKMEHKLVAWFERAHMDDMYNVLFSFAMPDNYFMSWLCIKDK